MKTNRKSSLHKLMKIFFFIGLLYSWNTINLYSQMVKVPLEQLSISSRMIIKGTVSRKWSAYETEGKNIVTFITFKVSVTIKGEAKDTVTVVIPGGVVGIVGMGVSHTPKFRVGEDVVVFISEDHKGRATVTEWQQGKFPVINGNVSYESMEVEAGEFVRALVNFVSQKEQGTIQINVKSKSINSKSGVLNSVLSTPSISSITPGGGPALRPYAINPNDPFNPGERGAVLDLYGSNFGSTQGTSKVRFYENGSTNADAEDYLLWTDTHVQCKVPGGQWTGDDFPSASSGSVYVVTSGGTSNGVQFNVSFSTPNKRYSSSSMTFYVNQNGTPDADGEFTAIQNALQTWSGISNSNHSFSYGGTTSRMPGTFNGYNDIGWVESNWPYSSSSIAVNLWWFDASLNSNQLYESDIFVNGVNFMWSTTGQSGRMDVQNIATHELGHALSLSDLYGNNDGEKTMYGYSSAGETKQRTLETDDIAGAVYLYPQPYSLTFNDSYEFDPGNHVQINIKNVSQATNTIAYNLPLNRTTYYGSSFELTTPSQQTVNGKDYRFYAWSDGATQNPRSITPTTNTTLTAMYKAHLASNSAAALAYNNQRKVVKWGYHHLVYQSVGDIWYTYSTDNGATWAAEQMVSAASDGHQNTNPAVDVDGLGNVYVVYEAPFGSNRAIAIKQKVSMTWIPLWSESFLASSELKPVIAVSKETSPKVVVVVQANGYTSSDPGLYYAQYGYPVGKVSETSASSLNPTLAYGNLAYQESNTIYRKSVTFTNPITISSREAVSTAGFNGRPLRDISNPSIAVREALDYEFSRRPVIAWQAIDLIFSDYRPIFVRHPVSTSGGSPVFVTTVFDWGTYNAHGRTPTVNVYQTPPSLGYENPDVSVVWQDDPIDGRYGAYQNVVVANKINGSWNTQTTLSTAGQYSSVAQGDVSQTTSGGALVCWSGTSGPILSISASQKTNSGGPPPPPPQLAKGSSVTNNATEYAREININLGALAIEGLAGTVGVHIEETTGAKFVPLGKLGSLEKDFLKLQNQTQSAATVKYKVWVYDLQIPQALTIPQRDLEIASLLIRKDSVTSQKKNFTLENLLGLWKANHSKLGSIEVAQDSGEVVVHTGTFVQVQTRQDTASQDSGVEYLQIIAPDNGEQLRKQAEQEIIANQPPGEFALASNYPNPFNPETQIKYQLKDGGYAKLAIYDVLGREIAALADEYQPAGYYSKPWNASLLASGMYIYRLTVRDESGKQIFTQTKRMMLMK